MVRERDGAEDVGGEALLCLWLLESLLPEGRGELEEAVLGPPAQEAEDDGVDAGALVAAEEQPVFPSEDLAAEVTLGDIVLEGEAAVVEEAAEGDALVAGVADGLRDGRVVQDNDGLLVAPLEERVE